MNLDTRFSVNKQVRKGGRAWARPTPRWRTLCGLLLLALFPALAAAQAQPDGRPSGVIRIVSSQYAALKDVLTTPTLFEQGEDDSLVYAAPDNFAIVESSTSTANTITLRLRTDLLWSDGMPVTLGETVHTLRDHILNAPWGALVTGMTVVNHTTVRLSFENVSCGALPLLNTSIGAVHTQVANLETLMDSALRQRVGTWHEWNEIYRGASYRTPTLRDFYVTGGRFALVSNVNDRARFEGRESYSGIALEVVSTPGNISPIDAFLAGESNLLPSAATLSETGSLLYRLTDLEAAAQREEIQLLRVVGHDAYVLIFNRADPNSPRDGYTERGEVEPQGENPITSDPVIREALSLLIDRPRIADYAYDGLGVPIYAPVSPRSWAYPTEYAQSHAADGQLNEAVEMLTQAGWRDNNGDRVRECITCSSVAHNSALRLRFVHDGSAVAEAVRQQAARAGIALEAGGSLRNQDFDIALVRLAPPPADPSQQALFSRDGDRLNSGDWWGFNAASLDHPEAAALLAEASTPDATGVCPVETREERAALYAEAYALLLESHDVIPLVTPVDLAAARGIVGFQPRTGDIFFGLRGWIVTSDDAIPPLLGGGL